MSAPFITSIRVETFGAHEHVRIWVRGQLVGTLIMGPGDGARLEALLGEPPWLAKDFNVLYRVTRDLLLAVGSADETRTAHALNAVAAQLTRLEPAFLVTEALRGAHG